MEIESRQAHWESVYTRKGESEVSWFQENPAPSLELIAERHEHATPRGTQQIFQFNAFRRREA
jgi:hypothetical protein